MNIIDYKKNPVQAFDKVVSLLQNNKIVVLPTDTIYGLSCRADSELVVKKILKIKNRKANKAFIILVSSLAMAKKYIFISQQQSELIKKYKTKSRPTTFILKSKYVLPQILSSDDSLAIRLTRNSFLKKIIRKLGVPLVSTSVNISGRVLQKDVYKNIASLKIKPDALVDAGILDNKPSRLIDITGNPANKNGARKIKIIRK